MGYSEKNSDTIFEPFRKLHGQKICRKWRGMNYLQKIINNHSGILCLKRAEDLGTEFIIILFKKVTLSDIAKYRSPN